jgi:GDP-L-fucose synthase
VGGIHANNTYPADFLYHNLMIETNVIHAAHTAGVQRLLFLGSSCIYPRDCAAADEGGIPAHRPLEPTNEPYAIAKIAGIKLCESYNRQYGTRLRFVRCPPTCTARATTSTRENSHVMPALMRRFHEAKLPPTRRGGDLGQRHPADARVSACYSDERMIGEELSIAQLAQLVADTVGFAGALRFDPREAGRHGAQVAGFKQPCPPWLEIALYLEGWPPQCLLRLSADSGLVCACAPSPKTRLG